MDIAQLSINMSQNKVAQQASVSVVKKAMDVTETQMQGVMEMMPSNHRLDIRA